ncbi:LAMI_0D02124g1_1 [Lachancea mirantina]|uniref:ER membrane protein complex subunit 4 n=1 Tax=Lachancea mirantina TaxID=1230905 RepID=A0A1G4J9M7_9SACH|nr:LAMI_0D02124g1_1 [Lachancea mirantina]
MKSGYTTDTTSATLPNWTENLINDKLAQTIDTKFDNSLPSPPSFKQANNGSKTAKSATKQDSVKAKDLNGIAVQKAWQISLQPAKSIPLNMVMSYMSGSSLQIISIMTALMLISNPVKSVVNIRRTFKPVLSNSEVKNEIMLPMMAFVLFQGLLMAIGVHKLNSMGLIPNTRSDWLFLEKPASFASNSYAF